MSTIFKISEDGPVPKWLASEASLPEFKGTMSFEEADRIASMAESLDDDSVVLEMDAIEKCASAGRNYYYSAKWGEQHVAGLREYAEACGFKGSMVAVDPEDKQIASYASKTPKQTVKTASASPLNEAIGDPFHLEINEPTDEDTGVRLRRQAKEHKESKKDGWQAVAGERKLANPDVMMTSNCVIKIPGSDDYRTSRSLSTRRGENSIAEPDAIGALAKTEDTGERLHREARERQEAKKAQKGIWQQEIVQQAKDIGPGALTRGSVFMTEAGDAGPGGHMSGLAPKEDIPERTLGESLKSRNETRKASIQRRKDESKEWQRLQGASRHEISDVFVEELEKALGKK
jgi:hypothetical protein